MTTRYNVTRTDESIQRAAEYMVVEAAPPKTKWSQPGQYATRDEAQAAADKLTQKSAEIAATTRKKTGCCCDCGDCVPLTPSPRGMICDDCRGGVD